VCQKQVEIDRLGDIPQDERRDLQAGLSCAAEPARQLALDAHSPRSTANPRSFAQDGDLMLDIPGQQGRSRR
jgi:hypothetical protein